MGFDRLLREGLDSYEERIEKKLQNAEGEARTVLESFKNVCQCIRLWHRRYMNLLQEKLEAAQEEEKAYYRERIETLKSVPFAVPKNFKQGLQALWFAFAFVRLCGNWPGIGRLDAMLGELLEQDLAEGNITLEEAREWIAHFFIKGCEWVQLKEEHRGSGDAPSARSSMAIRLGGRPLGAPTTD